jgi:hypothetical protein
MCVAPTIAYTGSLAMFAASRRASSRSRTMKYGSVLSTRHPAPAGSGAALLTSDALKLQHDRVEVLPR